MLAETARIQGGAWGSQLATVPGLSNAGISPTVSAQAQQNAGYDRLFPALQLIQGHTGKSAELGISQATKTVSNTQKIAENTAKLLESQGILTRQLSFSVLPSGNSKGFFGDSGASNDALVVGRSTNGYLLQYDPRTDTCEGLGFNEPDPSLKTTDPFYLGYTKNNPIMSQDKEPGYGWSNVAQLDTKTATPQQTADYNSGMNEVQNQLAKIGEGAAQTGEKTTTTLQEMNNKGWSVPRAQSVIKQSDALTAKGNTLSTAQAALLSDANIYLKSIDTSAAISAHGMVVNAAGNLVVGGGGSGGGGSGALNANGTFGGQYGSFYGNAWYTGGAAGLGASHGSGSPSYSWGAAASNAARGASSYSIKAEGGFEDNATVIFGEAGREAFVPIANRAAGLRILPQVMKELGVRPLALGGIVGRSNISASSNQPRNLTVNIYPSPGMNETDLAKKVVKEIGRLMNGKGL
jgi:hypothetical protein